MNPISAITYASRLVSVPPGTAEIGFDLNCRAGTTVTTAAGRLELEVLLVDPPRRGYYPSRRLRGTLRPATWTGAVVPVDLELLPWSSRWSELGLMPLNHRWPHLVSPARYFRAAHQVLDQLVRAIEDPFRPRLDPAAITNGRLPTSPGATLGRPWSPSEAL
ncbi:MAG: hypothetical protein ACRD0O_09305 [Acidimicrobiia bacterium]